MEKPKPKPIFVKPMSSKKTRDERQAAEYEKLMGEAALERQKALAAQTCPVCFGKDGQHSQMCSRRRAEQP